MLIISIYLVIAPIVDNPQVCIYDDNDGNDCMMRVLMMMTLIVCFVLFMMCGASISSSSWTSSWLYFFQIEYLYFFPDWIPLLHPVHGVWGNNLPSIRPLWIRLQVHAKTHLLPAGNHQFSSWRRQWWWWWWCFKTLSNLGTAKLARIVKLSNQFLPSPFDQFSSSFGLIIIILI